MYTNADSISNKIDELQAIVDTYHPNIISITETLPKTRNPNLTPPIHHIPGYNGFHRSTGRGISVYIDQDLKSEEVRLPSDFSEAICVNVLLQNSKTLTLGCIYRSPNSSSENNDKLLDLLYQATLQAKDYLIIVGDFNIKEINWDEHCVNTGPNHLAYRVYD